MASAGIFADILAQLSAAADSLVDSLSERSESRGRQSGATIDLATKLSTGRKIVHILDAFVNTALTDDHALLANWNQGKRVQKVGVRSATITTTAEPMSPYRHTDMRPASSSQRDTGAHREMHPLGITKLPTSGHPRQSHGSSQSPL